MHVNWGWIKQRPHFIAEGMSKYYDIIVLYKSTNLISKQNNLTNKRTLKIHLFFLYSRMKNPIKLINSFILKLYFRLMIMIHNPDYIWITFPDLYDYIPKDINAKIIYDCMDNAVAIENIRGTSIAQSERVLVKDASLIFVTSTKLALKLNERAECKNKIKLIRNAFDGKIIDFTQKMEDQKLNYKKSDDYKFQVYTIGYIGTISSWFDIETLLFTLTKFENIEYHLIGPISPNIDIKKYLNKRIHIHGPVIHQCLYDRIKDFDCLIMPFKVNDVVESVDPVKFYEYINFNKPIISVFYDEIKRFYPYVYFYSNELKLVKLLGRLVQSGFTKKYSNLERAEFLEKNSWDDRISEMVQAIKDL